MQDVIRISVEMRSGECLTFCKMQEVSHGCRILRQGGTLLLLPITSWPCFLPKLQHNIRL